MSADPTAAVAQAIRQAAVGASLAPSIYNTQPWRFVLGSASLEIHAEWARRLQVLDTRGRQLVISCGCAVFNARVVLAAAGLETHVDLLPDVLRPGLLARLRVLGPSRSTPAIAVLLPELARRRSNRQPFTNEPTSREVVRALVRAATHEGVEAQAVARPERRRAVIGLSAQAGAIENTDRAYLTELRAWSGDDPRRRDGVLGATADVTDDGLGRGGVADLAAADQGQVLLLLGTEHDSPVMWLRTGQALERVLLGHPPRDDRRPSDAARGGGHHECSASSGVAPDRAPADAAAGRPRGEHPGLAPPPTGGHDRGVRMTIRGTPPHGARQDCGADVHLFSPDPAGPGHAGP